MKPERRTWAIFWIVALGVAALIMWGEWLDWRRRQFATEKVRALEQQIQELRK